METKREETSNMNTTTYIQQTSDKEFVFNNVDVSIVNGLRRILLSELPHIAFDAVENNNNTNIEHNTGSLYNELIVNRLALIPLNTVLNICTIKTQWNSTKSLRECLFLEPEKVPKFRLDKINSDINYNNKGENGIDVTAENFEYVPTLEQERALYANIEKQIFHKDAVTGDHCLLTILQPSMSNDETEFQRLAVNAVPVVGQGKKHASFSQVGTVLMEFLQDQTVHESMFQKKLEEINVERETKGRTRLSKEETPNDYNAQRMIFNTIDKQRYYHTNQYNEPNQIKLTIESVNSKKSNQLLFDAIQWAHLMLDDIYNELNNDTTEKIKYSHKESMDRSVNIHFEDYGHTIANILSTCCQQLYMDNRVVSSTIGKCLQFASYRVPHPDILPFSQKELSKVLLQNCIRYIQTKYLDTFKNALSISTTSYQY